MAACPLLPLSGASQLRPGGNFTCVDSQIFGQVPLGTIVNVELDPVRLVLVANQPIFQGPPPTPTQYADQMVQGGFHLIYLEIWEDSSTILGFGYVDFYYIGVYY